MVNFKENVQLKSCESIKLSTTMGQNLSALLRSWSSEARIVYIGNEVS